jgi:dolichol-phosphate mannosyltransferase
MNATRPPVTVVIPCFNEAEGLPALLARLQSMRRHPRTADWHFLFIDDGSTDDTFAALLQAARTESWIEVVRLHENRGLGAALRMGFEHARSEIVCTIDSDCTYAPERLPELTKLIEEGADIATASGRPPERSDGEGRRRRLPVSRRLSAIYKQIVKQDVHTLTCLFRAYRREVLDHVVFRSDGFSAPAEISLRAALAGYNIRELPIPLERRLYGESKSGISEDLLAHAHLIGITVFAVCMRHARQALGRSASSAQ